MSEELHNHQAGAFTRLATGPSEQQIKYSFEPVWPFEKPFFNSRISINLAWITMLGEEGIIDQSTASDLLNALLLLEAGGPDAFDFQASRGDVYFNLQADLMEKLGTDHGGQIYIGRSRIDGDPAILRLYIRERTLNLARSLNALSQVCMDLTEKHLGSVMPGYTGSQAAQPWTFGHYLLSFVDAFQRDVYRLQVAYSGINKCPLGAGTGAGSDLPLNRERAADLLGFEGLIENSREFITANDAFADVVAACSIVLTHMGQLAHDLHTWHTQEFAMIELGDEYCGSSSFMPQKKNPTATTQIRATASASVGLFSSVMSVLKTSSQDFDYGLMKRPLMTAVDNAQDSVDYMASALASVEANTDLMKERALLLGTTISEVARLVQTRGGLDWRTSHFVTERAVRIALDADVPVSELSGAILDEAGNAVCGQTFGFSDDDIRAVLDPQVFVETRCTRGSPNPDETERMLKDRRITVSESVKWIEDRDREHSAARDELTKAISKLTS